jgi:hypothetical protein
MKRLGFPFRTLPGQMRGHVRGRTTTLRLPFWLRAKRRSTRFSFRLAASRIRQNIRRRFQPACLHRRQRGLSFLLPWLHAAWAAERMPTCRTDPDHGCQRRGLLAPPQIPSGWPAYLVVRCSSDDVELMRHRLRHERGFRLDDSGLAWDTD